MRTTIFSSVPYKFLAALAIIAMVLAALPAMPAYAASITVTNITDDLTSGNGCSLREAIINANNNGSTYPDCTGGSGADTIILASGSTHILSLTGLSATTTGDLDITDAAGLTIQASGATPAIIDGGDIDRVLDVASGAGNLTLTGITIQNGTATSPTTGGGISFGSIASLTLTNSTVSSNVATAGAGCGAGIYNNNGATINITNSTIADNTCSVAGADGAGLFKGNSGAVNISNSTFYGNNAEDTGGGAQFAAGVVTITNSTFYNNSAGERGGAIQVDGAAVTVEFSTFSGNTASSASSNTGSDVQVSTGSAAVNRSILANAAAGKNCDISLTGSVAFTNSLVENNNDCAAAGITSTADPALVALGNNGGPTQTMAITTASPAYNAAVSCNSITTDQRGETRPSGGSLCDLGAYEFQDVTAPTVVSITRVGSTPTSAASVDFTVTFSEPVDGVGASDFSLTTTGVLTGPFVSSVTASPATTYTVTVNTGSGNGTIRLNVPDGVSIADLDGNPLANLPFESGESYTLVKTAVNNWFIRGIGAFSHGTGTDIPVPADYNGDGKDDLAVFRPSNSTWYIYGVGSFAYGTTNDIPVVADYNGDGKADIAVFRPSNSTWYIYGVGSFVYGTSGDIPVVADYNGDGKADIAVFRESNSTWYILGVGPSVYGQTNDIPVVADYNGDGKADIAVFRESNSTWYIRGIGSFVYGTTNDIPVVGDYNGDGKADIAVFRESNSTWYILGVGPSVYGTTNDIPVVADYNGDGKADIAVFRP